MEIRENFRENIDVDACEQHLADDVSSRNPPPSAVPASTGLIGCIGLFSAFLIVHLFKINAGLGLPLLLGSAAFPMWLWDFFREKPTRLQTLPEWRFKRNAEKVASALLIWISVLGFMHFFAASNIGGFFDLIFEWWWALVALVICFFLSSSAGNHLSPEENIENLYRWLARKKVKLPWLAIRVQIIKAFFLPMMAHSAYVWLAQTSAGSFGAVGPLWFAYCFTVLYLIDTIFGVIGYTTTARNIGAHVRSTDKTWWGWISALSCYAPFSTWIASTGLTAYSSSLSWSRWLPADSFLAYLWGAAIILLSSIYAWATISFGLRFSNLTNRGIITCGPYRYSKHPAYIAKNLSWWLISIPFVPSMSVGLSVLHCGSLLLVNAIYFFRAKTEERHLMQDATYREYSVWIERNGLWAMMRSLAQRTTFLRRRAY